MKNTEEGKHIDMDCNHHCDDIDIFHEISIMIGHILLKTPDDSIDAMFNNELFNTPPYVLSLISNTKKTKFMIIAELRRRVSFFSLFNLFEWQSKVNQDL